MNAVPFLPSLLPGGEGLTEGIHDMNPLEGSDRASEMRPSILRAPVMCY